MSLGILKIAAVLEKANLHVEVLDLSGVKNFLDVVSDYVTMRRGIRYFGLTSTTPQLPAATQIAHTIHGIKKNAKVILGGPHITLVNAAYKKESNRDVMNSRVSKSMQQARETFDILVSGDGEKAIFEAIKDGASAMIDADNISSPLFLKSNELSEYPFPARHLVDLDSYHYSIDGVHALSLIAQLGCPFNCGFCGGRESPMLRRIRTRTPEKITEEMEYLFLHTGRKGFMFYDDELNINKNIVLLMHSIADRQKKFGVEWRLRGFIKSELFTDEQAEAMYRAGFRWILVGFESGSPEILLIMNKKATLEENTRCVEIAKRHNLKVKALMSIGHPGENHETVKATREWLLETKPDDFDISIITCYPGTPYYDLAIPVSGKDSLWVYSHHETGARLYQNEVDYSITADYFKGDPNGGYKAYVYTDSLSSEELVKERDRLEQEVRNLLKVPFYQSKPSIPYEHSMGQMGQFPKSILRATA